MRFPRMMVLHNFSPSKNVSRVYTRDGFQRRAVNARGSHGSLIEGVFFIMPLGRILAELHTVVA